MRILLVATAYNGLSQRAHIELVDRGHEVSITLALSEAEIRNAVSLFEPDLIICPFLKEKIPTDIFQKILCIILHPGIKGDRGASSLDWAILNDEVEWGATALQADEEMDAGDIWDSVDFPMRAASKASLYRREVTRAAIQAMLKTVERVESGSFRPEPLNYNDPTVRGTLRPSMKQSDRAIRWKQDNVATILKKIHAGDSAPGVVDLINGEEYHLFGAHEEGVLRGAIPGDIIAKRHGAICRAAIDGAVWISHLKKKNVAQEPFLKRLISGNRAPLDFKLPATMVLGDKCSSTPEAPIDLLHRDRAPTFREIWYEEGGGVGYLHFDFHNGAMSTEQCRRLREAYVLALKRPTRVIVLMGGTDFWSNGIHLNMIEAADSPADESWRNINAIDDVVLEIITTSTHLTISAVWGGAGAGGAIMTLAADEIWAREGAVMNPHYKTMGLYGSEYWTYLLPRRVGPARALELTEQPLPIGMKKARSINMIDAILPDAHEAFTAQVREKAEALAARPDFNILLEGKRERRARDEAIKPLAAYRAAELARMRANFYGKFYGGGVSYHQARHDFVHKIRPRQTAAHLARHTQLDFARLGELRQPLTY
ncbi:hydrogenase maturation protein [Methylocystis echinoides]|uniref:Hydrogenase maturation factor HoxX n=1 Tax=Methylocystis echinoides TaxID=29468 RepID=A0A9W6GXU1_9HYPH|nr:hydrogenase maturation protein [Methylocystis echinoides]GLI94815.1 hydrogenase maturation factor HoxX [Methylocystis echinoides]